MPAGADAQQRKKKPRCKKSFMMKNTHTVRPNASPISGHITSAVLSGSCVKVQQLSGQYVVNNESERGRHQIRCWQRKRFRTSLRNKRHPFHRAQGPLTCPRGGTATPTPSSQAQSRSAATPTPPAHDQSPPAPLVYLTCTAKHKSRIMLSTLFASDAPNAAAYSCASALILAIDLLFSCVRFQKVSSCERDSRA